MSDKKVCVITGASGGIGKEVVKKYYKNGYSVVMLDIKEEALKKVIESENLSEDRVSCLTLDVSSEQQVIDTIAKIKETQGRIDVLVNTAGIIGKYDETIDYTFENFKRIYEINVFGTFLMMKYTLPVMLEQGKGAIVNFGSCSGMTGYTSEIGYGSSKWAVIGMTKNVANEYARKGHPALCHRNPKRCYKPATQYSIFCCSLKGSYRRLVPLSQCPLSLLHAVQAF